MVVIFIGKSPKHSDPITEKYRSDRVAAFCNQEMEWFAKSRSLKKNVGE
ncbi:MAG: hypothetical protein FWD76_04455 [Firmicutes bacterium]|nr:hypothetical protein [Bacillota bacterium]